MTRSIMGWSAEGYRRGTKLAHHLFESHDDIVIACFDGWNSVMANSKAVRSIATRGWAACRKYRMAIQWAKSRGLPTQEFLPDKGRYGLPLAFFVRNHQIGDACDLMVAFWDGRSSGTRDAIDYCQKLDKPIEVIEL